MLGNIILFLHVTAANCLIVFDEEHVKINMYGTTKVEAYLLAVDIFYRNYSSYAGCDIYSPPASVKCDIKIFTRLCIVDQSSVNKKSLKAYGLNHTFIVDSNATVTKYTIKDFNCGDVKMTYMGDQKNSWYSKDTIGMFINTVISPYSEILVFTCYTGDEDWGFDKFIPYGIYSINTEAVRTMIQENIYFAWEKYLSYFKSYMYQKYRIIVKCAPNYFGRTCWFHCTDNIRRKCNCEVKATYSNVPCNPKCNPGWITTYVIYTIGEVKEGLRSCANLDLCYRNHFCQYTCLPINNITYLCEKIFPIFQSNLHAKNITSDVFLYNEFITVSISYDTLIQKDVAINTSINFNASDFIFKEGLFVFKYGSNSKTFQIKRFDQIDVFFDFQFKIYLAPWDKRVRLIKVFRINVRPDQVFIFHDRGDSVMENTIYIGESVYCNSTAIPSFRTIYTWSSPSIKFNFPFAEKVHIPDNVRPKIVNIIVNATLIIHDRPNEHYSHNIFVFVKPFIFFEWNTEKNILDYTDKLECKYQAYITAYISIVQIQGPSSVNTMNKIIRLDNLKGGEYNLLCFFITPTGLKYTKKKLFYLRAKPIFICLFLFIKTIGSLIQCGHNGFIYDEYIIKITFQIFDSEWKIESQGYQYVRVPYYLKSSNYLVKCVITERSNKNINYTYEVKGVLSGENQAFYPSSTEFQSCPEFANYIQKPQISEYLENGVVLKHRLVYLSASSFQIVTSIIIFMILIFFLYLTIFLFIRTYSSTSEGIKALKKRIKKEFVIIKQISLNRRLEEESKKGNLSPEFIMPIFFNFDSQIDVINNIE